MSIEMMKGSEGKYDYAILAKHGPYLLGLKTLVVFGPGQVAVVAKMRAAHAPDAPKNSPKLWAEMFPNVPFARSDDKRASGEMLFGVHVGKGNMGMCKVGLMQVGAYDTLIDEVEKALKPHDLMVSKHALREHVVKLVEKELDKVSKKTGVAMKPTKGLLTAQEVEAQFDQIDAKLGTGATDAVASQIASFFDKKPDGDTK
jgi:hypothetical protein